MNETKSIRDELAKAIFVADNFCGFTTAKHGNVPAYAHAIADGILAAGWKVEAPQEDEL